MVNEDSYYNRLKKDFQEKVGDYTIQEWGLRLKSLNAHSFPIKHNGTVFKLYSLYEYLIYPYLHIISNQRHIKQPYKMVYLDLFAGSGLNEISDENGKKYFVLGSPILAILASFKMSQIRSSYNCYFDKMILIDSDKQARDILFDRCQTIIDNLGIQNNLSVGHGYGSATNIQIINGDITNSNFLSDLHQYLYQIQNSSKIHLMLFIDPPNPSSIELSLLKHVLSYPSDIIMLLHSGIFASQVKKQIYNPSTLEKMLGIDSDEANWLLHSKRSHHCLEDYYVRKCQEVIQNTRENGIYSGSQFRDVNVVIPIKTTASNYYLLYATRKTGGNSEKWQKPAEAFAKWMGRFSDSGPTAISILQGSQSRLNEFY